MKISSSTHIYVILNFEHK